MNESIAPPTNSQYGTSVTSEYRIPHASHSILSFFPPNYDSSSGGSASNETPPRLSHSIVSLFPPNRSQSESSRSDESLPPFSHSIPSIFPPTQSETESSESNERLITRSSPSPSYEYLYPFELIRSATNNFLAETYTSTSSTRSWRCTLRGKNAIVFQRKFRHKMRMRQLTQRLFWVKDRLPLYSIIRLLGASVSGDHIYLVYDFVDGPNLANCLRNPNNPNFTVLATWISRMQIAWDLAHGLASIHNKMSSSNNMRRFVHNHIKSSSIIVTKSSFNAKICHIGTAQLCGEIGESEAHKDSEIQEVSEEADRGYMPPEFQRSGIATQKCDESEAHKDSEIQEVSEEADRGYMPQEFQRSGIATQKCDVYAFGVVILELLSGEEPLKYKHDKATGDVVRTSVIETAAAVIKEGADHSGPEHTLRLWVDRRLNDLFPVDVAKNLIRLALDCVDVDPDKRPDMTSVAWKISKLYSQSNTWSKTSIAEQVSQLLR